eukprot:CAMPEP_0184478306 /NCGR_PEP_ID=MMETSP0113_2-20130426/368_1 /TAXON_ID=91329 /ORGANISM="Norrisiella sphaerica, Strain BC52" /LENGTH=125 /DNA_ID=CAMNT_0026856049 /DNA_START=29 /DNA_END=406 /DNA_ORIENTATION=+
MELADFKPRTTSWTNYLLIASVFLNVALVLALCFSSFGAQNAMVAAPLARPGRTIAPKMAPQTVGRKAVMKGAMAGVAGSLLGAMNKARADTDGLKDKSVSKICSSNPTASVCVKPGGLKAAAKR